MLEVLHAERGEEIGYTTVLKLMQIMHGKGLLVRDDSERTHIYQEMARLVAAYAPVKLHTHRKRSQMVQPWVLGWRRNHSSSVRRKFCRFASVRASSAWRSALAVKNVSHPPS